QLIAIVVDAVADLELRLLRDARRELTVDALHDRDLAAADAARGLAHVVDRAVAVVVHEVARLIRGLHLADARGRPGAFVCAALEGAVPGHHADGAVL